MSIIDLSDFIDDPQLRRQAKESLSQRKIKLKRKTGVIAKLHKSKPFEPAGLYQGKDRHADKAELVVIYDRYECRCSNTWFAPRYNSATYMQVIDTTHRCHYDHIERVLNHPTRVEYHSHKVDACPLCVNKDLKCTDPTLARMFQLSIDDEQLALDFNNWLHKPSDHPLIAAGERTSISGIRYARRTLKQYRQYFKLNQDLTRDNAYAILVGRFGGEADDRTWSLPSEPLLPRPTTNV